MRAFLVGLALWSVGLAGLIGGLWFDIGALVSGSPVVAVTFGAVSAPFWALFAVTVAVIGGLITQE